VKVYKWNVPVDDHYHPIGSGKVVHVATLSAKAVSVWTEHEDGSTASRPARVYVTGQPIPDNEEHLGTVITTNGKSAWHVYGGTS
jgi:hypothetical protein